MAESVAASILQPVVNEAVEGVVAVVKRQFNYLCCFSCNISDLKDEANKLEGATGGLQGQVERERENLQVIVPEVETWLRNSDNFKADVDAILNEVPNVKFGCLSLRAHFSLSKKAKKTTAAMKELRENRNFGNICMAPPPAASNAVLLGTTYEFESRKKIEEEIMTSLRSEDMNMIGICGMGGLGKTTMAKKIMNRALEEHVFDEVVMTVVSQQVEDSKIQLDIARSLGLKLEEESSQGRVQKLHARLSTKRTLLVLDDVWEKLVLEDLGIPRGSKGCTIFLTSRNSDVLSKMNVQKVFGMKVLSDEEAWFLFREKAGTCVDDKELDSIAKKVMKECRGLPIALATVGAALKDKSASIWEDALEQLGKANPIDIPDVIKEVYNLLRVSYDLLDSEHAKSLFLLFCLFPEDQDIYLSYLTYSCMGLRIFEDIGGNLKKTRNRVCTLIERLKGRSLLLDGVYKDCVRMHDVVRDVCIFIAKQKGYIDGNNCSWISLSGEGTELPTRLGLPNLHLLFMNHDATYLTKGEFRIENTFFEGMSDLFVLSIKRYSSTSLPQTTQSLKNLRSLIIFSCRHLETLSVVGELVNLEILSCANCYSIKELSSEIKGLNRLKLLDFSNCGNLQSIGRGIISSLVGLEELKMLRSFKMWEADEREEGRNAKLRELESLTNLRCLEIEIEDPALAAERMQLSSEMDRFVIKFLAVDDNLRDLFYKEFNKKMSLRVEGGTCLGHWVEKQLLRDTERLILVGDGANNLDLEKYENIRRLALGKCQALKNIVFRPMEYLHLFDLPELEEIWDGPISLNSFQNLKELRLSKLPALKQLWRSSGLSQNNFVFSLFTNLSSIKITSCARLRNLGQLSIAGEHCLSQLEILEIKDCKMMEQVFLWNEGDENRNRSGSITKIFPKLKKVELDSMPNLTTFFQGIEGIEFPQLEKMYVVKCPKMRSMVCTNGIGSNQNNSCNLDDDSSHLFCQPEKVSFGSLKDLRSSIGNVFSCHKTHASSFSGLENLSISNYHGSMCLFTSSIAGNLVNLRELNIRHCDEMVEVIRDIEENAVSGGERKPLLFPKLQTLSLSGLPKLVRFWPQKYSDVELPSLKTLFVKRCPNMTNFSLGPLTTPNLENFNTDLNNYFQVSFRSRLKELRITENEDPLMYRRSVSISSFRRLTYLTIYQYQGSMSIFSSSIAGNLVNLRDLKILDCGEIVKVIEDEEEEEKVVSGGQRTLLIPNLQNLQLASLPKLVTFCEWKCDVELPSLRELNLYRCPNMTNFTLGPLKTPNLKSVEIEYKEYGLAEDLNVVLQQRFAQAKQEEEEEEEGKKRN